MLLRMLSACAPCIGYWTNPIAYSGQDQDPSNETIAVRSNQFLGCEVDLGSSPITTKWRSKLNVVSKPNFQHFLHLTGLLSKDSATRPMMLRAVPWNCYEDGAKESGVSLFLSCPFLYHDSVDG